jgi:hypothetical protein
MVAMPASARAWTGWNASADDSRASAQPADEAPDRDAYAAEDCEQRDVERKA